ncbi:U3 small nucleolar ribonucleoprotein MPP10 [Lamellibrachia satsuma]|nr:U3 small nucleolar ribonucleoprotein MPP10 [Lamellibrachia satsuma]
MTNGDMEPASKFTSDIWRSPQTKRRRLHVSTNLTKKMANDVNVVRVLTAFSSCTSKPENFIEVQDKLATQLETVTKQLYDATKILEDDTAVGDALPELIVDNFDNEQMWQEIELQNDPTITALLTSVSRAVASKNLTFAAARHKEKIQEEEIEGEEDEENEDDDIGDLRLDQNSSDDDESEEEKEMKLLLDKAEALVGGEIDSDDDNDGLEMLSDDDDLDEPTGKNSDQKGILKSDGASKKKRSKPTTRSIVDDRFFKLADMEAFLEQEDAKEGRRMRKEHGKDVSSSDEDEEEEVDMFADIPSEDEQDSGDKKRLNYDDFFDPPSDMEGAEGEEGTEVEEGRKGNKRVQFTQQEDVSEEESACEDLASGGNDQKQQRNLLDDSDDGDEDMTEESKSSFEKRQQRLRKKIESMEKESVSDKPWQLWGEIASDKRPENSLLQEDLDFEHTTRPAPAITEETTMKLEDLIKQRVKDQAWDDVERKVKQVDTPFEYKKRVVLDQEKSKLSLGEVYEAEFLKQTEAEDMEVRDDPQHAEIKKMMDSLFVKLDALSNFHYTPKPAAPEIKIVSNQPAIAMEEVAPVAVSDTAMLAPQEIQEKAKKELKGPTEKTEADRKRDLRIKKKAQRERRLNREHKEKIVKKKNLGLGNKYAKEQAMREMEKQGKVSKSVHVIKDDNKAKKNLTSSKQFFGQLQEEVNAHVKNKRNQKTQKAKENGLSSSKLKL